MLKLVESNKEKLSAHGIFVKTLRGVWRSAEVRRIVWRPGSRELEIIHNGVHWFATAGPHQSDDIPRFWDPFGNYRNSGNLVIAVEVNIPTTTGARQIAGFYAKDDVSGQTFLMHDGGVGGGRKGVGRYPFLQWSAIRPVPVFTSRGDVRLGVIVAPIDRGEETHVALSRFIDTVARFKAAVKRGDTITKGARKAQLTYKEYFDEASGKRQRKRVRELEYISRHGEIVKALHKHRAKAPLQGKLVKNAYIDLGVECAGALTELFEVKSSCDRQAIYTAIGQILAHDNSAAGACKRFLVLPDRDPVATDLLRAFKRLGIVMLRFTLKRDGVDFLKPDVS